MRPLVAAMACVVLFPAIGNAAEERAPSANAAPEGATLSLRRAHSSVALLAGYGLQLDTVGTSELSAYRFGFGARAGVTLPVNVYVGGTFVAHVGTNLSATRDGSPIYVARIHDTYFGPEGGYDLNVGRFLLRPYVGVGLLVALGKTSVGRSSLSDDHAFFYVAPGAVVAYRVHDFVVGVDLRIPIVPAEESGRWAPAALLTLGMTLD